MPENLDTETKPQKKMKLLLEYEGTRYCGWQSQKNGVSIQEIVQGVLSRMHNTPTIVWSSGRTDAGVHAQEQMVHFFTESRMTDLQWLKGINGLLPTDIVVKQVSLAEPDFHAQASCKGKLYRYTILNRDFPTALDFPYSWYLYYPLDVEAMREAVQVLEGRHDFTSFRGSKCGAKSADRYLMKTVVRKEGDRIQCYFIGNGFLKHMIRIIMGTVVLAGRGLLKPADMTQILEARNRRKAGPTAPAKGLCLMRVFYDIEERSDCLHRLQNSPIEIPFLG